jgi:hypothetical protein
LLSSFSICTLVKSSMWVSLALLPMPGLRVPLREATPYGQSPNYLIRDRDGKFGSCFARVAVTSGIKMLKTPYHAPRANAICERFLLSVRRECLDHLFIFGGDATASCPSGLCPVLQSSQAASRHQTTDPRAVWCACPSGSRGRQNPLLSDPGQITPRLPRDPLDL